jgi:hypothetical protein
VDEWGLIGTRQALELLRLREKHGFTIVALGDDKQCSAVAAGNIIDLSRRALGAEQIPEILTTRRQQTEREQKIAGLLRKGRAAEALAMKRSDGSAEMIPGGEAAVAQRVAALWRERLEATGQTPTIAAPTNTDAHNISAAVRSQRRELGQIGPDVMRLQATDGERNYNLPLAIGDRVRLYRATKGAGRGGSIGRNGSVLEVVDLNQSGVTLKSATGRTGGVAWEALTHANGRIHLAYGDCMTIHTAQGSTTREHILALPHGSQAVNGPTVYSGSTRHEQASYLVTSEAAERAGVQERRPLNAQGEISADDKWANVARNFANPAERDTATALRERAGLLKRGSVREFQAAVSNPTQARNPAVEHVPDLVRQRWTERMMERISDLVHEVRQRAMDLVRQRQERQEQRVQKHRGLSL